jgi:hypothetical protein
MRVPDASSWSKASLGVPWHCHVELRCESVAGRDASTPCPACGPAPQLGRWCQFQTVFRKIQVFCVPTLNAVAGRVVRESLRRTPSPCCTALLWSSSLGCAQDFSSASSGSLARSPTGMPWRSPFGRVRQEEKVNDGGASGYCNFAYSALACCRMGCRGSALSRGRETLCRRRRPRCARIAQLQVKVSPHYRDDEVRV